MSRMFWSRFSMIPSSSMVGMTIDTLGVRLKSFLTAFDRENLSTDRENCEAGEEETQQRQNNVFNHQQSGIKRLVGG